jgi:hypothetical protein
LGLSVFAGGAQRAAPVIGDNPIEKRIHPA